jgi:hypothetical protein
MMPAMLLLRLTSQILHSLLGGMSVFCLWYSAILPSPGFLLLNALKFGAGAIAIAYCQRKYLSNV